MWTIFNKKILSQKLPTGRRWWEEFLWKGSLLKVAASVLLMQHAYQLWRLCSPGPESLQGISLSCRWGHGFLLEEGSGDALFDTGPLKWKRLKSPVTVPPPQRAKRARGGTNPPTASWPLGKPESSQSCPADHRAGNGGGGGGEEAAGGGGGADGSVCF